MTNNSHIFIEIASTAVTPKGQIFPNEKTGDFIDKLIEELCAEDVGEFVKAGGTSTSLEITFTANDPDVALDIVNRVIGRHVSDSLFTAELISADAGSSD